MNGELLTVTLNAKQIRQACEAFVSQRIYEATERAKAEVPDDMQVIVTVTKKRIRKAKNGS